MAILQLLVLLATDIAAIYMKDHFMGLGSLLSNLLYLYTIVLFGRALMSWFDPSFSSSIGQVVYKLTEPVLEPVRRVIRPMGGLDLSIMVTIFLMIILQRLIAGSL